MSKLGQDGVRLQMTQFGNAAIVIPKPYLDEPYPSAPDLALVLGKADALKLAKQLLLSDDLPLMLAALEDAAAARRERAAQQCTDCNRLEDGKRCPDHLADTERAAAYYWLAARLAEGGASLCVN
jgi:hypothetical protein